MSDLWQFVIDVWHLLAAWLSLYVYVLPGVVFAGAVVWAAISSVVRSIRE